MTNVTSVLEVAEGAADFVSGLVLVRTTSVTSLARSIGTVLLVALALMLAAVAVLVVVLVRRRRLGDTTPVLASATGFILSALGVVATLISATRRLLGTIFAFLTANARLFLGLLALALLSLFISAFHAEIISVLVGIWAPFVYVYRRVGLGLLGAAHILVSSIMPIISYLFVRVPIALATGLVYDGVACSEDAITAFAGNLTVTAGAGGVALGAWFGSGDASLTVAPDFGPTGLALGATVASLNVFVVCACQSIGAVTLSPLPLAFAGPPAPYAGAAGDMTPFATAVNSTFTIPFVIGADVARPIVLTVRAALTAANLTEALGQLEYGAVLNFNGTLATAIRLFNGTAGVLTNVVQRYYSAIAEAISGGPVPDVDFPRPPPVIFECATGWLAADFVMLNTVANIVFRAPAVFTTFNGLLAWRATDVYESVRSSFDCLCAIVDWLADVLRWIGNDIQATCVDESDCGGGGDACVPQKNTGRCLTSDASAIRFCSTDAQCTATPSECAVVPNVTGTVCIDALTGVLDNTSAPTGTRSCTPDLFSTTSVDCEVCVVGGTALCSDGRWCAADTECAGAGECSLAGRCLLRDSFNTTFEADAGFATCVVDADCDRCFGTSGQCTGGCGAFVGDSVLGDVGGCILSIFAAVLDTICCLVRAYFDFIQRFFLVVWDAFIGTVYTLVARAADATNTVCTGPSIAPDDEFYCSIYRATWVFDFIGFQAGAVRELPDGPTWCPRELCYLRECTVNADCAQQGTNGLPSTFFDQVPYCNTELGRCTFTDGTCSAFGPVGVGSGFFGNDFLEAACVHKDITPGPNATARCSFARCTGSTCTATPRVDLSEEADDFDCDCVCPPNEVRSYLQTLATFVVCIGDVVQQLFGTTAAAWRCLIIQLLLLVLEAVSFVLELLLQGLTLAFVKPDSVRIGADALARTLRGTGKCIVQLAAGVPAFGLTASLLEDADLAATTDDALAGQWRVNGKIAACLTNLAAILSQGLTALTRASLVWARLGDLPDLITDVIIIVVTVIVNLFSLLAYVLAYGFYALAAEVPATFGLGDALEGVGDDLKDAASAIASAIIDIFIFLGDCIAGIVTVIINSFACLGGLAESDNSACVNLLGPLEACLAKLEELILQIFYGLLADLTCFLRFFECILVPGGEVYAGCATINATECMDMNLFCGIEMLFCDVGIVLDLVECPAFMCPKRDIFCFLHDFVCSVDIVIYDVLDLIESPLKFIEKLIRCFPGPPTCTNFASIINFKANWPYVARLFAGESPPKQCCITENQVDPSLVCYDERFVVRSSCVVQTKFACFIHLNNSFITSTFGCSKKRQLEEPPLGNNFLLAFKQLLDSDNETLANMSAQMLGYEPVARIDELDERAAFSAIDAGDVGLTEAPSVATELAAYTYAQVASLLRAHDIGASGLGHYCLARLDARVEPADMWPPLTRIMSAPTSLAAGQPSAGGRFLDATCASYLHEHALDAAARADSAPLDGSLADVLTRGAAVLSPTGVRWLVRYGIELGANTVGLLYAYAGESEESARARTTAYALVGEPAFALAAVHCTRARLPAAIVADWLTPTLGLVLRTQSLALRGAQTQLLAEAAGAPVGDEVVAARTLFRVFTNTSRRLAAVEYRTIGTDLAAHLGANHVRLEERRKRTPRRARRAAPPAVARKRTLSSPSPADRLAGYPARKLAALSVRFETVAATLAAQGGRLRVQVAPYNTTCLDRTSPFTCCDGQSACIGCSLIDRVLWALEDGGRAVGDYYSTTFTTHTVPCALEAVASQHGLVPVAARACPAAVCGAAECTSDAECAAYAAANASGVQASTCAPLIDRCAYLGSGGCAAAGTPGSPCLRVDFNATPTTALGTCSALGVCENTVAFDTRTCRCPPTFLTRTPTVPFIGTRFTTLRVPCLLNTSCVLEAVRDPVAGALPLATCSSGTACDRFGDSSECAGAGVCLAGACYAREGPLEPLRVQARTCLGNTDCDVCFNHSFVGEWAARKADGPNIDRMLVALLDSSFNGAGSRLVLAFEDAVLAMRRANTDGRALERFAERFLFCDYRNGWFCPVASEPDPAVCCSDRCEERTQGVGLAWALVWVFLIIVVPVLVASIVPGVREVVAVLWPRLVLLVAVPLTLQFAYEGGFLCYIGGPLQLIGLFARVFTAVIMLVLTLTVRLPVVLIKLIPSVEVKIPCLKKVRFPRKNNTDCSGCLRRTRGLLVAFFFVLSLFAALPTLPTCAPADVYTAASELGPPCAPLPVALVDVRAYDVRTPCIGALAPPILSCNNGQGLGQTRFDDGIDNILYIVERVRPGTNERLAAMGGDSTFGFLAEYAAAHTTEAHASGGDRTETCFYLTITSIALGILILLFNVLVALTSYEFVYLALGLLGYVLYRWARGVTKAIVAARAASRDDDGAAEGETRAQKDE